MDEIRLRQWAGLSFQDPAITLPKFRVAEILIHRYGQSLTQRARELRTNQFKRHRELRDAAIFCFGLGTAVIGSPVHYADHESEDFDFIGRFYAGDVETFIPVQLKELPPLDFNASATLEGIYSSLEARSELRNTLVAVKLNQRAGTYSQLPRPKARLGALWFFWKTSQDHDSWCLFGDAMDSPRAFHFHYPA